MPAYSKRGLENGGGVTQSEVRGDRELGYWAEDAGRGGGWKRKGGGGLVVQTSFCDVDSRPPPLTMMTA